MQLVPFTAELLPAVQPWFHHPEVQHRLGGPDWPIRELTQLLATEHHVSQGIDQSTGSGVDQNVSSHTIQGARHSAGEGPGRDAGQEYRGMRVLRVHSWVAVTTGGAPLAKVGGDVYHRWARYDGSTRDAPLITGVDEGPAMGLYYVVDPALWRRGIGRAALRAVVCHPALEDVRLFALGIDADNWASRRCAAAAGFEHDQEAPDFEGTVYYLLRR